MSNEKRFAPRGWLLMAIGFGLAAGGGGVLMQGGGAAGIVLVALGIVVLGLYVWVAR